MDAIAVSLATNGTAVGLAPLGTSLTDEQAAQLHALGGTPVIATDADYTGRVAAEKDFWILAPYGTDPLHASLPDGADPAELVAGNSQDKLTAAVAAARPLAEILIDAFLDGGSDTAPALGALRVVAARTAARWPADLQQIADRSRVPAALLQSGLAPLVRAWNANPRRAAQEFASQTAQTDAPAAGRVDPRRTPKRRPEQRLARRVEVLRPSPRR
jgi:DNA primase